jgi:NAD(P)-dependent dehydrogenase (short-subunit alcohol dehydrogenase family)
MSEALKLVVDRSADVCGARAARQRVSLVTGGTDGIGRAVALELARGGDRVLFVGRNPERGAEMLAALRNAGGGDEHRFIQADLALLAEAARVGHAVKQATPQLDSAILCAGVLSAVPEWTEEQLERTFVLNYLSRFLLVQLLASRLEAASGRVVLVANAGKYPDTLDFDDLQHRRGKRGLHVSGRTQFANDLLATELAERFRQARVDVSCVFPGVTRSSCFRNARGLPWIVRLLAPALVQLLGRSPEAAARTPVFLAREAAAGEGGFYGPERMRLAIPARVLERQRRAALWAASAALVQKYVADDQLHVEPAAASARFRYGG